MGECSGCAHWIKRRVTRYDNGEEVVTQDGDPICNQLKVATTPDFGCNRFTFARGDDRQIEITTKTGASWQHWVMGPCPDCGGKGNNGGDSACHRCAGTSKVRYYDDGFIGEERTRRHPKELEVRQAPDPGTQLAPLPAKGDVTTSVPLVPPTEATT